MSPKATGLLLLVALALGAFVYFWELRGGERRREAEAAAKRLFGDVEVADIAWLELPTTPAGSARLELRDGAWWLSAPLDAPADGAAADGIAEALLSLTSEGEIEDPRDSAVYGLADGARVLRFAAAGTERELRIGKKTPIGSDSYLAADGTERVYLVPSHALQTFERTLVELRESRPLRFDRERVRHVEVSWPGGGVSIDKREDTWQLREPVEQRADDTALETLLSDLGFLRAEAFLDVPPPDAELGLDAPAYRVVLGLQADGGEDATTQRELVIGADREGRRAARGSDPFLYLIPAARYDDLPRTVNDFRYRQLTSYVAGDANGFELALRTPADAERVETARIRGALRDETWETTPQRMRAGSASLLVSALAGLRARSIVADRMGDSELASLELKPPNARIRIFGAPAAASGGKRSTLADLHLGTTAGGVLYAKLPNKDTVYALPDHVAENIPVSLEAFRNRFLSEDDGDDQGDVLELGPEGGDLP